MKRLVVAPFALIAMLVLPFALANPLMPDFFSELIPSMANPINGPWRLEVNPHYTGDSLDGWSISSRAGTALFKNGMKGSSHYFVITQDSLQTPLPIDPAGDSITVRTSAGWRTTVVYGPGPECDVQAPEPGWSLAFRQFFCLDTSPTMGAANDTAGAKGQISGIVIDSATGAPLAGVAVWDYKDEYHSYFVTNDSGKFAGRFFAHNFPLWVTKSGYRGAGLRISLTPWQYLDTVIRISSLSSVDEGTRPTTALLIQSYPNPFNPSTTIVYELPTAANVKLQVFDAVGRELVELVHGLRAPGQYKVAWNGRDAGGTHLGSGIYLARLTVSEAGGKETLVRTIKLLLLQ